jgi:hypothetical protein
MNFLKVELTFLATDWEERVQNNGLKKYDELLKRPTASWSFRCG